MSKKIKYLVMDVDGTLTDGKIYMGNQGEIMKAFDIKDGYGIHDLLIPNGITPIIITGRFSQILENRCHELGITDLFQNIKDKSAVLQKFLDKHNASLSEVAYIGDDLNDADSMQLVKMNHGLVGVPINAHKVVIEIADFISQYEGGNGAVRDFIEHVIKSNND